MHQVPRANRHFIPGQIWHITHRCHKREFLLKLVKDRQGWTKWLREAKLRYDLTVFNWIVTSNHIHILLFDEAGQEVIPRSMQLIAGRTAQEYNQRKKRKGAFWEDRYHATAIEAESHLLRCLVYIDLNMVRAGVVKHPADWPFSGYHEIQSPQHSGGTIAYEMLAEKAGFQSYESFRSAHKEWVREAVANGNNVRRSEWSESIAVGSETFVCRVKEELGARSKGRTVLQDTGAGYQLREPSSVYENFGPRNYYLWKIFRDMAMR